MCVFTVVSLMKSWWPISAFERPRAIRRNTSRSRVVRVSTAFGGGRRWTRVNCAITRRITVGRQERVAHGDGPDRRDQLFGRIILEDEPARARPKRLVDVLVEIEGREEFRHQGPVVGCSRAQAMIAARSNP